MEGQKEWNALTESERLEIIKLAALTNNQWKRIGETIGRNPETCKKFFYSYKKYNTIFPKQGRPKKVDDETEQNIVNSMRNNPLQTLRDVAEENNVSKPTAKTVLNDNKIKYYRIVVKGVPNRGQINPLLKRFKWPLFGPLPNIKNSIHLQHHILNLHLTPHSDPYSGAT